MQPSVSSWLSSRLGLGTTLLAIGLLLTLGVVACSDSVAPSSESPTDPDAPIKKESSAGVYTSVPNMENPPDCGGVRALSEKIQYPELARKAGIEGRVIVQFIVEETGDVVDPTITQGVHEALNKESIAAVKSLDCEPGTMEGDPVLNDGISYPDLVRKAGIEGRVEVTFTLDASGNAENPRVTQSLHRALDAQALHSVKNTTFVSEETKTGKLAGKMISVQFAYRQPGSPS